MTSTAFPYHNSIALQEKEKRNVHYDWWTIPSKVQGSMVRFLQSIKVNAFQKAPWKIERQGWTDNNIVIWSVEPEHVL